MVRKFFFFSFAIIIRIIFLFFLLDLKSFSQMSIQNTEKFSENDDISMTSVNKLGKLVKNFIKEFCTVF
jgi:hypothetical protein